MKVVESGQGIWYVSRPVQCRRRMHLSFVAEGVGGGLACSCRPVKCSGGGICGLLAEGVGGGSE